MKIYDPNPKRSVTAARLPTGRYEFVLDEPVKAVSGYMIDGKPTYKFYTHFETYAPLSRLVYRRYKLQNEIPNMDVKVYYNGGLSYDMMSFRQAVKVLSL